MALLLPNAKAKHYILAALTATLISAVIITVGFVILSPAHIHFSVVRTGYDRPAGLHRLSLAIAANNPSRRAAVEYQSMDVEVSNNTWSAWSGDLLLPAKVTTPLPLRQPTRNVTTITASLTLMGGPWTEAFTGNMTSDLVVTVTSLARFKVGVVWTRLYDIKVSCGPIDFFFSAAAHGRRRSHSSAAADSLPIDCQTAA